MDAKGNEADAVSERLGGKAAQMGRERFGEKADGPRKPHVVVIMADQLRYDMLGTRFTPNLNRLAADSAVFERAYCASPLCVPARGAFFTGMHPNANGCLINPWEEADAVHGKVRGGLPNLISLMEKDWDSWHVGKQHLLTGERMHLAEDGRTRWIGGMREYKRHLRDNGKRAPGGAAFKSLVPEMVGGRLTRAKSYSIPTTGVYEPGFDYFFDGFFARQAVEAIRGRGKDRPLLLNAMFLAPHPPFDVPEPWHSMWADGDIDLPDNVGHWDDGQSPLQLYNLTGFVGTRYSREEWKAVWRVYAGLVSLLDHGVGMIVDELKAQGMYDDTLIVFTSDHGEMLGSHRLWQKMCMYEESVRVPLYFKLPAGERGGETAGDGGPQASGKQAGVRQEGEQQAGVHQADGRSDGERREGCPPLIDTPVSAIDVLPTLCDLLGLRIPPNVQGVSLAPLLAGESLPPGREHLFIQYDGNGARGNFQRCVLADGHKLIVDLFKDEIYLELYDVRADRQERSNLVFEEEHRELVLDLLRRLHHHMRSTGDLIELPEPEPLLRQFLQERGMA